MEIFSRKAKDSEQATGKLDDAMKALSPSTLVAVAGVTSLVASLKGLTSAFKTAIGNFSHFEKMEMGLTTFYHDAELGKQKFEELRKLSNETTYGVDELTDAFTQMANVGVDVDTIKDKLVMLGNVTQGDKVKFAELTSVYTKIQSTGKAGAMQLQQIASRGIPIYDMLKKMGVQGTATAKDITKAFKNMTSAIDETTGEAGQFYNAMNNINETIEGKEGFISDYFKEFTVNFAEVSGIADAYKAILDVLKEKIGNISDKLLEWNSNPLAKAILQGTLATGISVLVGIIGVGLVGAISVLNKKLKETVILKSILNPATLALAVGAGVITGLVVAVKAYKKSTAEAVEETKKMAEAVEEAKKKMGTNYNLLNVGVNPAQTRNEKLASEQNTLKLYNENLTKYQKNVEDTKAKIEALNKSANGSTSGAGGAGYILEIDKAKAELAGWEDAVKKTTDSIEKQTKAVQFWEAQIEKFNISDLQTQFDALYDSSISKEEKQRTELESSIKTVEAYEKKLKELNGQKDNSGNTFDYEKSKVQIDATVNYLRKQLKEVKIKIAVENLNEWQKVLMDSMGFTGEEVLNGFVKKGDTAVTKFTEKLDKELKNIKAYSDAGLINVNNLDLAGQKLEKINAVIQAMRDSGQWGADEATTNKMKDLQTGAINDLYLESIEAKKEELAILQDQTGELAKQAQIKALMEGTGYSKEQAEDIYNWNKKLTEEEQKQNDILGWIANKLAEKYGKTMGELASLSFDNIISSFQTIGQALAQDESVGKALKMQFMSYVSEVMKHISVLCIEAGVKLIAKSGWAGVAPALALFALGGASGLASGFAGALSQGSADANEQQKQLDLLKSVNEQYKDLIEAMREQEEYYLKKKSELNMSSLKDKVTQVNDMILTPHGNFSTHPNDTIIATKNPEGLGSGKVTNNIKIINNAGVDVQTSSRQSENGMNEILVTISRKIQSDMVSGSNGWDSAFAMQRARVDGRRV